MEQQASKLSFEDSINSGKSLQSSYFLKVRYLKTLSAITIQRPVDDDRMNNEGTKSNGRGNKCSPRKHVPVLFHPAQIPHDLTCAGTRAAAVEASNRVLLAKAFYRKAHIIAGYKIAFLR
jgi:hypothetical protein